MSVIDVRAPKAEEEKPGKINDKNNRRYTGIVQYTDRCYITSFLKNDTADYSTIMYNNTVDTRNSHQNRPQNNKEDGMMERGGPRLRPVGR